MNIRLMEADEASEYTGAPHDYLNNQAKTGFLSYILTSPKKILFDPRDLDTWMAKWKRVEAVR